MPWYQVVALAEKKAVINIYEQIGKDWWDGSGVSAKSFADTLASLGDVDQIDLHVNSPGGNVYDGLTIYNLLKRHKASVTAYIDGIAASIASVIVMAADKVVMPENATMFLHDPLTWAQGDADDFRAIADDLDRITVGLISAYRDKTGLDDDEIRALMRGDTLLTAADALEMGFADELDKPVQAVATLDVDKLRADAVAQFKASKPKPDPAPTAITVDQVLAFLDSDEQARANVLARVTPPTDIADATAVIDLCEKHGVAAHAAALIKAKLPLPQVEARVHLMCDVQDLLLTANVEMGDIMNHLDDPMQMMRIAVTNTIASRAPVIHSHNQRQQAQAGGQVPNRQAIYQARQSIGK